jgi:YrbI family 3-deoxy-D-manno-octulosonate 8-phosphate phosphatase
MIFDIDGVFTDGGMYYTNSDEVGRKFNTKDGLGIRLLQQTDIIPIILTGKKSKSISRRAKILKIEFAYQNVKNKLKKLMEIMQNFDVELNQIIYVGDDWNDFPVLKKVGLPICVRSAPDEIKKNCKFVTTKDGGNGAVREAIEFVLKKEGIYQEAIHKFVSQLKNLG